MSGLVEDWWRGGTNSDFARLNELAESFLKGITPPAPILFFHLEPVYERYRQKCQDQLKEKDKRQSVAQELYLDLVKSNFRYDIGTATLGYERFIGKELPMETELNMQELAWYANLTTLLCICRVNAQVANGEFQQKQAGLADWIKMELASFNFARCGN